MATLGGVIPARERWIRFDATSRRSPGKEGGRTRDFTPHSVCSLPPWRTPAHWRRSRARCWSTTAAATRSAACGCS
eukprot:1260475-Prymnesium_polylepis.1